MLPIAPCPIDGQNFSITRTFTQIIFRADAWSGQCPQNKIQPQANSAHPLQKRTKNCAKRMLAQFFSAAGIRFLGRAVYIVRTARDNMRVSRQPFLISIFFIRGARWRERVPLVLYRAGSRFQCASVASVRCSSSSVKGLDSTPFTKPDFICSGSRVKPQPVTRTTGLSG